MAASAEEVASTAEVVLHEPAHAADRAGGEPARRRPQGLAVKTLIDLSTTGPTVAGVVAKRGGERGVAWVDSPVSGGIGGATKGTLAVMVSCQKATFRAGRPGAEDVRQDVLRRRKAGLAQIAKLANNLLAAAAIVLSSEAVAMGVKAGLDAKVLIDIINAGSGRNSATQDKFPRSILPRTFDFGFATGLSYKDVRLCSTKPRRSACRWSPARRCGRCWRSPTRSSAPTPTSRRSRRSSRSGRGWRSGRKDKVQKTEFRGGA